MSVLIGPRGGLIDVSNGAAESVAHHDTSSEVITRGGMRQVWRRDMEPRSWTIDLGLTRPRDVAALQEMLTVTPGPLLLVTPWMQITNAFTPEQASFAPATLPAGVSRGGAVTLADGSVAAVSALNPTGAGWTLGASRPLPVASMRACRFSSERRHITAQVAVRSLPGANATVALWFRNLAGTVINESMGWPVPAVTANTPDDGRHHVRAVSGPVPDAAVDVVVRLQGITHLARASVTHTTGPMDWYPGQGVGAVDVARHLPMDVARAVPAPSSTLRYGHSQLILREVG